MTNEREKKRSAEYLKNKSAGSLYTSHGFYDVIIIGAGICGIIFLAYAHKRGLRCLVLDKQNDVGGLWNKLPAWQDLQNRRQDIALDDVPLDGVDQPAVLRYVRKWIERFKLEDFVQLGREVMNVSRINGDWSVHTKQGDTLRTNYLIIATGVQNEPWIPDVKRTDSKISEFHSFDLRRPEILSNQRVTVVGGGASSQDLLALAVKYGAKEIHWVYRDEIKWFLPTKRVKQRAWPNLRELAVGQSFNGTGFASTLMRLLLSFRYNHFGIQELAPEDPFNFNKHQLIPGRYSVIQNLDLISRHRTQIQSLHKNTVKLADGENIEADQLLWGTGYNMNLEYLDLEEYSQIHRLSELYPKLGSLVKSLDYGNLFFLGMSLINSTSSTPLFAAVEAKTIISHILGECTIPDKKLPYRLTHWDLIRYFASFDRFNYPKWWKIKYLGLSLWYEVMQNRSIKP